METNYTPKTWRSWRNEHLGAGVFLTGIGATALACGNYDGIWLGGVMLCLILIFSGIGALAYGLWAQKKYKEALKTD